MWNSGFETAADVHTVPVHAVHRSYGAVDLSATATPSVTVVDQIVAGDSDEECDDTQCDVLAVDDQLQVGDTSIQHSTNEVLVAVDMSAPDQTAV